MRSSIPISISTALLLVTQNAIAGPITSGCVNNVRHSTPAANFRDNGDGTITDLVHGLMWQECSYGQTYDASTRACDGSADRTLTWQNALQDAAASTTAGHSDWRLPNVKELFSIVETACVAPAINPGLFPNTPSIVYYWTSSPASWASGGTFMVFFGTGTASSQALGGTGAARFVRTAN